MNKIINVNVLIFCKKQILIILIKLIIDKNY